MPKPAKPKKKAPRERGRPTSYRPEHCQTVMKLCRMGATLVEISTFLGVTEKTMFNWRMAHPEFDEAFFTGLKDPNARVEVSLFKQAVGYFMDEEDIRVIDGKVVRVPIRKWYPPTPSAAIFWAKCKMGWREQAEDQAEPATIEHEEVLESPRQIARRVLFLIHKAEKESAA